MLLQRLQRMCMVRSVDVLPRGHVRIETGFTYPDGGSVDVFVVKGAKILQTPTALLSDLGQTTDLLLHHDVKPWSSKKRVVQLEDAVGLYGVDVSGGALQKEVANSDEALQQGIVELGQACLRMSDLLFTKRLQLQTVFSDDVEEFLNDADLEYQTKVDLPGLFAPVLVDFLVKGRRATSAVMTLSARIPAAAHVQANEVFRKAHDLATAGRVEQRVALIDDVTGATEAYRDEDLRRIQTYATVVPFSERDTLQSLLAA
jgi:hypothetical protein